MFVTGSVTAAGAASIALQQATAARPFATNGTALPQHFLGTGATCTDQHQQISSLGGTLGGTYVAPLQYLWVVEASIVYA